MLDKMQKSVLMADDDEEDCFLATEAFTECGAKAVFKCVDDGIKLMDYLSGCSRSGQEGLPDLILLDLNMPRKDGRQALKEIKSDPALQSIPVVILTTSSEKMDIEFSEKTGADFFITKPGTFSEWIEIMRSLVGQWLSG
jgi:CheY-like chemotaxis protein